MLVSAVSMSIFATAQAALHEWGHLLGGLACSGRISPIRYEFKGPQLIATTELTWLWFEPLGRRLVPMLAGPLSDLTLLVMGLWLEAEGLHTTFQLPVRAGTLMLMASLGSQLFILQPTDLHQLFVHVLGYPNIREDAWALLTRSVHLSHLSAKQRHAQVIYLFACALSLVFLAMAFYVYILPQFMFLLSRWWAGVAAGGWHRADSLGVMLYLAAGTRLLPVGKR